MPGTIGTKMFIADCKKILKYKQRFLCIIDLCNGEVSEWFKVTTSKVVVGVTLPRVRIPPSPNETDFGKCRSPFRCVSGHI